MKTLNTKLNINSFDLNSLTAKLFTIQGDYIRKDILIQGKEVFDNYVLDIVRSNFKYNNKVEKQLCQQLSLFLLNDSDNSFSKLLNK